MSEHQFIKSYLNDFSDLLRPNDVLIEKLIQVRDLLLEVNQNNKKILIFGNGGSAAIASHFSVDLTKNARVRCLNFNEAGLITCFSNDYGFEHWVEKAVDFYGDEGDLLIVISSSGRSQNMLNGVKAARNGNFNSVVTLSGFDQDNPLNQLGDINLWLDSKAYNFVENIHQAWLLTIVDLIIGKREYSS
jgi:D-sedoheptulose 7-phosphate isomerase